MSAPERLWTSAHGGSIILTGNARLASEMKALGDTLVEYVRADLHREAILERDELRRANVTPDDADRPLGQSVEYWQDRALDHATALDRASLQLAAQREAT